MTGMPYSAARRKRVPNFPVPGRWEGSGTGPWGVQKLASRKEAAGAAAELEELLQG